MAYIRKNPKPSVSEEKTPDESLTPTSEPAEQSADLPKWPPAKLVGLELAFPTTLLNLGRLDQTPTSRCNLKAAVVDGVHGVIVTSTDERVGYIDFVPIYNIKKLRYRA